MPLLVQKYGGTSVSTPERREMVLQKIVAAKNSGNDVVVIVSAMGRRGDPYATDTFLDMLKEVGPNPDPKKKDLLASCGEIISACLVAHALDQKGYPAEAMTGFQAGIYTDGNFTNSEIINITPDRIFKALKNGKIAVIAGFQGFTEDWEITTLGRGGSDTTAIAVGGALKADLVEIYTDVPGVALTDPRLVPEAPFIRSIEFEPMYLLARAGAKVIHPRAVKTAITYNMPFAVRSTFSDDPGTIIGKVGENFGGIYGIALTKGVHIVKIRDNEMTGFWQRYALDELFYEVNREGCCFAVQGDISSLITQGSQLSVSSECDLITLVWDQNSGISAEKISAILSGAGFTWEGFFSLPSGGTWAVPAAQTQKAVQTLFSAFN
ncbi:MAG: aspartate kinase, partial [Bacillota bacterium]